MLTLLLINVFVLIGLEAALLYGLRALVARLPLSNWTKQVCFVIASVLLFAPVVMPIGISLALFVPNALFLAFSNSPDLLHWYEMTSPLIAPFALVMVVVSWWIGANSFLTDARRGETGEL
ncbi:hypothetical protein [Hyphomicrobium sp. 99]|uniref:hypothetical protein n=1 Tax=Hyphomicrobium sp. 99 TaxID=1163419 RepID=UPI0005F87183|nr:hypothetical protein [Hyphomicrobium sp. 99]